MRVLWMRDRNPDGQSRHDRAMVLLLTAALLLDPINAMWHTGSYQAFPLRWGMIPLLLLLTYAGRLFVTPLPKPEKIGKKKSIALLTGCVLLSGIAAAVLMIFFTEQITSYISTLWVDEISFFLLLIPVFLTAAAYALCLFYVRRRVISVRVASVFLVLLFASEFTLSFHTYMGKAADDDTLFALTMDAAGRIEDDAFYRVRMTKKYAHVNMVGAMGYPTLSHYTSLTREDLMHGVKRMGYSSYWMEVTGTGGTVLSDAVWNIRYLLGQSIDFAPDTETVWNNTLMSIGKTAFRLPGAVWVQQSPEALAALPDGSRADVQRALAERYLGLDADCVTEYPVTDTDGCTVTTRENGNTVCVTDFAGDAEQEGVISFALFVRGRQSLYFDLYSQTGIRLSNPRNGAVTVMLNGRTVRTPYPENNTNGLVWLCDAENEYVSVRLKVKKGFECESFGVFGLDLDKLEAAAEQIIGGEILYRSGEFSTALHTDAPGTVMLSAAYDEGFTAEVNGQAVPVERVNYGFMAVRCETGGNVIEFHYRTPGLRMGFLMTAGGAGLLAVYLLCAAAVSRKRRAEVPAAKYCYDYHAAGEVALHVTYARYAYLKTSNRLLNGDETGEILPALPSAEEPEEEHPNDE